VTNRPTIFQFLNKNIMAALKEYLGNIVAGITEARVFSDMESVKVAEAYAKHDLLQHFSIPRMRIQDVELTIPIALESAQERVVTVYEPIDNQKFNALVYKEIVSSLGLKKLSPIASRLIRSEIARQTQELERRVQIEKSVDALESYSKSLLNATVAAQFPEYQSRQSTNEDMQAESTQMQSKSALTGLEGTPLEIQPELTRASGPTPNDLELAHASLTARLTKEIKISSQTKALDTLDFIVESAKIREQKPENLIYIKMRISEEGMEWQRIDNGIGGVERRLIAE
jgi:hypothetical protein